MTEVLTQAAGFIFFIILAYTLKTKGYFKPENKDLIGKMALHITLPCVAISCFRDFSFSAAYAMVIFLSILINITGVVAAGIISRKQNLDQQKLKMMTITGYNIGIFTVPFVSSFLSTASLLAVLMFDVGNAVAVFGANVAVADAIANKSKSNPFPSIGKKMITSPAFIVYISMLLLSMTGLKLPTAIYDIADIGAQATAFLALMMIGIMLELKIPKEEALSVASVVTLRYIWSLIMGILIFISPLPYDIRKGLIIVVFAPLSTSSVIQAQSLGCKPSSLGIVSSVSIVISILCMIGIILFI